MNQERRFSRFIWIPRTIAIAFVVFLLLFSLDVFGMEGSTLEKWGAFIMHSIPSIVLTVCLIVFWKRPVFCGIVFMAVAVYVTIKYSTYLDMNIFLMISLPLIVIGFLFFIANKMTMKQEKHAKFLS